MSNKGIRELKRRKRREARKKRKRAILLGVGALLTITTIKFAIPEKDTYQIKRPSEYRMASGDLVRETNEDKKTQERDVHVATEIGFKDTDIADELKIEDSSYQDQLIEYVKCMQTQYAYQFPNDYSKTDKFIKEGAYLGFYGCENGFAKVKIDDTYYYVNKYGLARLGKNEQIKVVNGLAYVSEAYPLSANFDPGVDKTARRAFETMRQDMARENLDLRIASDYRGYDLEQKMFEAGEVDASKPGTSEHQLGVAFDFFTEGSKYNDKFEATAQYKWLAENAYKYGFIERYPKGKENITHHKAQPWHFRFVGVENAKEIYDNKLTLEEFLKIN
ncbi:M15 family metallopeptidase [Anaerococcus sp. NML200574]|uniref:M15 family metallopeptidase n=1 Tax=unclassified Anaerococcus TaxID=2614126 RepID=UPI000D0BD452|nr:MULTISPECIES: M15 family metallopeptidase [unclassified Anaerococcus]MCW6678683.1 M15 family metallopeptidase [Anaerococcus sp. NML200574]